MKKSNNVAILTNYVLLNVIIMKLSAKIMCDKMYKHWHFNKEANFGYVECSIEDCAEEKVEEHNLPEEASKCKTCGKPLKRTGPYSWVGGCEHIRLSIGCL